MSPTHNNVKSLSNRIFRSVLTFTLIVLFVFGTVMSAIFYTTYERDAEEDLSSAAQNVATSLGDLDSQACEQALSQQFSDAFRYTLIDTDGAVLYDSVADASTMENHADRPEVREADERGRGEVSRYSSTLGTVTLYSAVKLQNGDVVRLSETRESLVAFFGGMMGPIALTLLVAIMLVFLLSQRLTSRIMQPIDVLDFANPLENEIYEEMESKMVTELDGVEIDAVTAAALTGKLCQLANGAIYTPDGETVFFHERKLDALEDLIEGANGKPVLVAYWYKHDLVRIQERFKVRELKSSKDITDWNAGKIPVAVIHPASAGHGLNLQAGGSTLIWFGLTWSLELYQQTNARLWRQGQQAETVVIHHIITRGTVDEDVMQSLSEKDRSQAALMRAVRARVEARK